MGESLGESAGFSGQLGDTTYLTCASIVTKGELVVGEGVHARGIKTLNGGSSVNIHDSKVVVVDGYPILRNILGGSPTLIRTKC